MRVRIPPRPFRATVSFEIEQERPHLFFLFLWLASFRKNRAALLLNSALRRATQNASPSSLTAARHIFSLTQAGTKTYSAIEL